MSPYRPDSEDQPVSTGSPQAGVEFPISAEFPGRHEDGGTDSTPGRTGAWDGTVKPPGRLVGIRPHGSPEHWRLRRKRLPLPLADVGFEKIEIRGSGALVKRRPTVDVGPVVIAKGYGVESGG